MKLRLQIDDALRVLLVLTFIDRRGFALAKRAEVIDVGRVIGELERRNVVLDRLEDPSVCVLEPGCGLRLLPMNAEHAFYAELETTTLSGLTQRSRRLGGLLNLEID